LLTRIGLSGKICSGKSSASEFLVKTFGFHRLSFADPIRNFAKEIYGEAWHVEGRRVMQALGKLSREVDPLIFVKRIQNIVLSYPETPYVVDDVRFPNEVEALTKLGFAVFRIEASLEVRVRRYIAREGYPPHPEVLNHITETSLDGYGLPVLDGNLNKVEFCELLRKVVAE